MAGPNDNSTNYLPTGRKLHQSSAENNDKMGVQNSVGRNSTREKAKKKKKKKMEQPNSLCWSTTTLRTLDRSRRETNKTNVKHTAKEAYTNTANKPKKQNKRGSNHPPPPKKKTKPNQHQKSKVKEQKP